MILLARYRTMFDAYLNAENHRSIAIAIFCKSLYAFLFLKVLFLWRVLPEVHAYLSYKFDFRYQYVLYIPIKLAQYEVKLFLLTVLILLLAGFILRINYITAALIFWFSLNLSRFAYPFVNGSDYVLNLFLFLAIFLSVKPTFRSTGLRSMQLTVSNFAFLFCKIQFTLIYLFSGFDKLTSAAWRSGDAIHSITNLELFFNPAFSIPVSKSLDAVLAWIVILFELVLPIIIWFRRFRIYALVAGIIFHMAIMIVLSLPDFGLVMLLLYSLFIPFNKPQESSLR